MPRLLAILLIFGLCACGADGEQGSSQALSGLQAQLASNGTWPYVAVGILDIVEAGYGEGEDPDWAVGSLVSSTDELGVSIEIDGQVISRAGIDIDSGKEVRVWLEAPTTEYGVKIYPVSRIEPL